MEHLVGPRYFKTFYPFHAVHSAVGVVELDITRVVADRQRLERGAFTPYRLQAIRLVECLVSQPLAHGTLLRRMDLVEFPRIHAVVRTHKTAVRNDFRRTLLLLAQICRRRSVRPSVVERRYLDDVEGNVAQSERRAPLLRKHRKKV